MPSKSTSQPATKRSTRQLIEDAIREAEALGSEPTRPPLPTDAIPGFVIKEEIGRGGMGAVYRALQCSTKREVALKVILAGRFASANARRRFQREIELTARFRHTGIVHIFESGEGENGLPYYAMAYVHGVPFTRWCTDNKPDVATIIRVFCAVCEAVEHAHAHGVVHRDLKPANVLVDDGGKPYVLDFGLAKAMPEAGIHDANSTVVTETGQVVGTVQYLAPEQADPKLGAVDERTDVHALGLMLFEALTGELPFDALGSPYDIFWRKFEEPPKRPSKLATHIDATLEGIVLTAIDKERKRRYQSVAAFAANLRCYAEGKPPPVRLPSSFERLRRRLVRQRRRVLLAAMAVIIGFVGIWFGIAWRGKRLEQERLADQREARFVLAAILGDIEAGRTDDVRNGAFDRFDDHPKLADACLVYAQATFLAYRRSKPIDIAIAKTVKILDDAIAEGIAQDACRHLKWEIEQTRNMHNGPTDQAQGTPPKPRAEYGAEDWYLLSLATMDPDTATHAARNALADCASADPNVCYLIAFRLTHLLRLANRPEEAVETAYDLANSHPDDYRYLMLLGEALARNREYTQAIAQYTKAAGCGSIGSRKALRNRGVVRLCNGEWDAAIQDLSHVAESRPPHAFWEQYFAATALWITGDVEQVVDIYCKVIEHQGEHSYAAARLYVALMDMANAAESTGEPTEASRLRSKAQSVMEAGRRPGRAPTQALSAAFQILAGTLEPADIDRRINEAETKKDRCELHYYAGEWHRLQGRVNSACSSFEACVETGLALDPAAPSLDPMNEFHLARWRLKQLTPTPSPTSTESP